MYKGKNISEETQQAILSKFWQGLDIKSISKDFDLCDKTIIKIIKTKLNFNGRITDLRLNSKLESVNEKQIQCIYGSLLGDSSLSRKYSKNKCISYAFASSHCDDQKDYLIYKANILNVKPRNYIKSENSWSPGSKYWTIAYSNKLFLHKVYNTCFIDGIKTISKEWLDNIGWEGIAYWFMDDGCSHRYKNAETIQVNFSTLSFSKLEIDLLMEKFTTLGVSSHTVKSQHGKGIVLAINSSDVNYFMDKIKPFIVECMNYKIKKDNKKWKK